MKLGILADIHESLEYLRPALEELDRRQEQYRGSVDTMSPERREEVEADLTTRQRDLKRLLRDSESDLERKRQKGVRELEGAVAKVLDDFGKKNGYTLILQRDLCAFAVDTIDISREIIRLVDAHHRQGL